jgi:hypothetical protein
LKRSPPPRPRNSSGAARSQAGSKPSPCSTSSKCSLPLVWRQDRLIYVAGLGADVRLTDSGGARVQLRWQPASDLIQAD